jgi:mono/diheme cytochrome c family protein
MKTLLKILGVIVLVAVLAIGAVAAYIQIKGIPNYNANMPAGLADLKVEVTPERVAHGAKIAAMTCVQCHLSTGGKLTGNVLADVPKEFGWIHSANITQHPVNGIGSWKDGELLYMFRTSIRPDGSYVPPYMPAFPRVADEDLYSIIAWLRSSDPMLQATDVVAPNPKPSFLAKALSNFVFKPFEYPDEPIIRPDSTNELAFGKYLANGLYGCYGCHSADFKTMNELTPEKSVGFYGGGNPLLNLQGEVVPSSNITMHETGIGYYTKEEFIQAVRWGKKPDGTLVRYPMIPHTTMTDYEVGAIYEYLKTVPPIDHVVVK